MPAAGGSSTFGTTGVGGSWPMLAAVAPLLPDGSLGGFVTREGTDVAVQHGPGRVTQDGAFRFDYDARLEVDQPVAVLIDSRSASAAEALTTAFHGQPDTQVVGQQSAGFATGNSPVLLEDGALHRADQLMDGRCRRHPLSRRHRATDHHPAPCR